MSAGDHRAVLEGLGADPGLVALALRSLGKSQEIRAVAYSDASLAIVVVTSRHVHVVNPSHPEKVALSKVGVVGVGEDDDGPFVGLGSGLWFPLRLPKADAVRVAGAINEANGIGGAAPSVSKLGVARNYRGIAKLSMGEVVVWLLPDRFRIVVTSIHIDSTTNRVEVFDGPPPVLMVPFDQIGTIYLEFATLDGVTLRSRLSSRTDLSVEPIGVMPEREIASVPMGLAPPGADAMSARRVSEAMLKSGVWQPGTDRMEAMASYFEHMVGSGPQAEMLRSTLSRFAKQRSGPAKKPANFRTRPAADAELTSLVATAGVSSEQLRTIEATDGSTVGVAFAIAAAQADETWRRLRARAESTGHYPVLVETTRGLDQMLVSSRRPAAEILSDAATLDGAALLDAVRHSNIESDYEWAEWDQQAEEVMLEVLDSAAGVPPLTTAIFPPGHAVGRAKLLMLMLPCTAGWQVPAALDWGKARDIWSSAWWCAVLRHLEQDVGAILSAINYEYLDFVLTRPLSDRAAALELGRRIVAIAGMDGSAGYSGAGELAARLLHSDRFAMWFD